METEQQIDPVIVRAKIKEYLDEAKKLQDALDILSSFQSVKPYPNKNNDNGVERRILSGKTVNFPSFKAVIPVTFKSVITGIIEKQQRPITTKEAMALYIETTKKANVAYKSFSGQFSGLSSRDTALKKIVIQENPLESRYFYGLPKWFNGDTLKEEYLEKIKAV